MTAGVTFDQAYAQVSRVLVTKCLPDAYAALDAVAEHAEDVPGELLDRVRRLKAFYRDASPMFDSAPAKATDIVIDVVMPQVYVALDDMLDYAPKTPKDVLIRAKKQLPAWAAHSFEQSPVVKR